MQTEYSQIAAYEGTEIADAAKRVLTDPELLSWLKRTAGIRIPRFALLEENRDTIYRRGNAL